MKGVVAQQAQVTIFFFWEIMSHFSPHVTISCFENNRRQKKNEINAQSQEENKEKLR